MVHFPSGYIFLQGTYFLRVHIPAGYIFLQGTYSFRVYIPSGYIFLQGTYCYRVQYCRVQSCRVHMPSGYNPAGYNPPGYIFLQGTILQGTILQGTYSFRVQSKVNKYLFTLGTITKRYLRFQIGCVFAKYDLFKPTIFLQNCLCIYMNFRIKAQFYINFSRQEHLI